MADNIDIGSCIDRAAAELEEAFPGILDNVAFCVEQRPRKTQRDAVGIMRDETLLGLYEGTARTDREYNEGWMLPDKITLFTDPILEEAEDECVPPEHIVTEIVWHEVAHLLGLDEDRAHAAEHRRRKIP